MRLITQLLFASLMSLTFISHAATKVEIDESYCDGVALLAKAGVEAKRRGDTLSQWQSQLKGMQAYANQHKDNLLYRVVPKALADSTSTFKTKLTPTDIYVSQYRGCMSTKLGQLVTLN